jgi:hypothetical protein
MVRQSTRTISCRSTATLAPSSPWAAAEYHAITLCPPGGPTSARISSCQPSRPTTRPSVSISTHPLAPPSLSQTTSPSHGTTPTTITLLPRHQPHCQPLSTRPSHSSGLRAHLNLSSSRASRAPAARDPTTTTRRTRSRSSLAFRMGRVLVLGRAIAGRLAAVHTIGAKLVRSPSPIDSSSAHVTAHLSCKLGQKRRVSSLDSDVEHSHDEQEHKMPESVERDGMILGMKVEDYRALSARERKRVRNRISARTFRAKRKREHGRRTLPACFGRALPLSDVHLVNSHLSCYFPVSASSTATDIWYSRAPLLPRVNPRRQGSPEAACPRRGFSALQRGRRP